MLYDFIQRGYNAHLVVPGGILSFIRWSVSSYSNEIQWSLDGHPVM